MVIQKAYLLMLGIGKKIQSPLLLLIRLYWGTLFLIAGLNKLMDLEKTTGFFQSLGIPGPAFFAAFVGSIEFVGGFLLVVGFASRVAAVPLIFNMIAAYLIAHRDVFGSIQKFVDAPPFLFLLAALLVLSFGAGCFSLDHLIQNRSRMTRKDPLLRFPTESGVPPPAQTRSAF